MADLGVDQAGNPIQGPPQAPAAASGGTSPMTRLQAILALRALLSSNDPLAKAQAAIALASMGASTGGLGGLSNALGGAGFGLNLAQIARANASTGRKAVEGVKAGAKLGVGVAVPPAAPFIALQAIAESLGNELRKSGSPQVRGLGTFLGDAATPQFTRATEAMLAGDVNPRTAINSAGGPAGFTMSAVDPVGSAVLNALGINPLANTQTKGVQFRSQMKGVTDKLGIPAGGRTTNKQQIDIDPETFASLSPEARDAALRIGLLVSGASTFGQKGNAAPFALQAQNILLNRYGEDIVGMLPQVEEKLGGPLPPAPDLMKVAEMFDSVGFKRVPENA